jgi:murein DD-endopeptidase MepM/ murein hydrolase activator NlpD
MRMQPRHAAVAVATFIAVAAPTAAGAAGPAQHHHTYRFPIAHCATSYGHSHHDYPATDIFVRKGCDFVAPIAGKVDEVSRHDDWNPATDRGATRGGLSVSIVGTDGVRYYGSHLSHVAHGIHPGVQVKRGQLLGLTGESGNASGPHLHFGISWTTRNGIWWVRRGVIWPWRYLNAWHEHIDKSPVHAVKRALKQAGKRVPRCHADC